MKHSIRIRFALIMMALASGTILLSIAVNSIFLEKYYMNSKREALTEVYAQLQEVANELESKEIAEAEGNGGAMPVTFSPDDIFSDFDRTEPGMEPIPGEAEDAESVLSEEQQLRLNQVCEANGVTLIMVGVNGQRLFAYGAGDLLSQRLMQMYMSQQGAMYEEAEILEQNENYTLHLVTDPLNASRYYEMHGVLNGSNYFVLRVALESISESADISNRFYAIVGLIMIFVSSIIMWFVSKNFTKPIHELAHISEEMSELNFDIKYTGQQKDEIGLLGHSMNRLSETLEETISQLKSVNLELENDIAKKDEIDRMRQEFISNVSHELKTPIALIQGYAEGLKDSVIDDAENKEFYCDVIIDEAEKMNRMVKKLLTLNQIESGNSHVTIERFDLVEALNGILQASSLLIKQNDVKVIFRHDGPAYVWADQYQVEEVITNYISNALNHIKDEKVMKIQLEDMNDTIRVSVYNTGDHIPEEDIGHIWDKFYKVDKARTREYGGNGIGLSIVKAIMESMHQSYGVKNVPGGVMFWFEVDKKNK